jgi:hypothetical protein
VAEHQVRLTTDRPGPQDTAINASDEPGDPGRRSLGREVATRGPSIFIVAVGALFLVTAAQLPFGSLAAPGPGLWPLIAGIVAVALGLLSALVGDPTIEALDTTKAEFVGAGIAFLEMFTFIAVFYYFGYFISGVFIVLVMGKTFGSYSWRRLLVVAVLFGAAVHGFFGLVLDLPQPNLPPWVG